MNCKRKPFCGYAPKLKASIDPSIGKPLILYIGACICGWTNNKPWFMEANAYTDWKLDHMGLL